MKSVWWCRSAAIAGCALAMLLAGHGPVAQAPRSAAAAELAQAISTAQRGDGAKALSMVQALLAKRPTYAPAMKFEGALYEGMGDGARAETLYEQALGLAPDDPDLLFKVGLHDLAAGDSDAAVRRLQRAAKLTPQDSETLFYLAQAYHLHDEQELALRAIARSAALDPQNAAVLQKYGELLSSAGDNAQAMVWLGKAQRIDPSLDRIEYDLAIASLHNEDLESAVRYGNDAVVRHPDDAKALALLGEVDTKLARWAEAKTDFERLLQMHPDDTTARLGLGHSELGLKQYQASVDTLEQVLREEPTTILAHFYLSRAYAGLGNTAAAARESELHNQLVERAGSVVPREEKQVEQATLVEARQMLRVGREADAVELFRKRSKGPTATPGAPYMLVGVSYLYMGRSQDAQRCLQKAMAVEPRVHLAHTYLGMLAMQRGNMVEAKREFDVELSQDPNAQLAVAELGELAYLQGNWAEAEKQFKAARTVSPAHLYMLSDAEFRLGERGPACLAAELAADYGKDDEAMRARVVDLLQRNGQSELANRLRANVSRP